MDHPTPKTVDDYIALQPAHFQATLQQLRAIILSEIPNATEAISYQVPVFKTTYSVIGFGVTKTRVSLYTMNSPLVASLKAEFSELEGSGSTIYFEPGQPLPEALVRKIVRIRVAETEERARLRGKK